MERRLTCGNGHEVADEDIRGVFSRRLHGAGAGSAALMVVLLGTRSSIRLFVGPINPTALGRALITLAGGGATLFGFTRWTGLTYLATVPPTTGIIARLYGPRNVPLLFGITMALHRVGSFLGVSPGGLELELTGD